MRLSHRCWWSDGLPPPPGWHFCGCVGGPRMSPTPMSAKYGATHGFNPCRGRRNVRLWSSGCCGAWCPHSRSHKVACPIITRYNAVVPGWVDTPTKCVPKVRPSLLANPLATGAYLRHAPGRGGADPGTTAVVPGYDQGCRFAALALRWQRG